MEIPNKGEKIRVKKKRHVTWFDIRSYAAGNLNHSSCLIGQVRRRKRGAQSSHQSSRLSGKYFIKKGLAAPTCSSVETADMLYEYFPLSLDDR